MRVIFQDAIAWSCLPPQLFLPLFRSEANVSAVFRNFVLAQRVMARLGRTAVSRPALPDCSAHPLWGHWDRAVQVRKTKQQHKQSESKAKTELHIYIYI